MRCLLSDVCIFEKGSTGIQQAKSGEYPLVVTADERLTSENYQFDCNALCVPLVSSTGHGHASLKRVHYQSGKFALGSILCAVIPKDENVVLAEYLYVYFSIYKDEKIVPLMKGAANVSLTVNSLKNIEIDIPELDIQKQIIRKYKTITSKINSISNLNNSSIDNIVKLKELFLESVFTGTNSWNESSIIELADICTGNSIPEAIKKTKYIGNKNGFNYIGTKDVNFDHTIIYENGVKIPFDEPGFKVAKKNDILLCIEGGSAGKKIAILEQDVCYGNKLCKFSTNSQIIEPKFLYYYLQSSVFLKNFFDNISGIIGGVSINKIKSLKIKYPSLEEQNKIINNIEKVFKKFDNIDLILKNNSNIYIDILKGFISEFI